MYLCVFDQAGEVLLHRNFRANPDAFLKAVAPYREDLVVAVECIFTWYWLADLCRNEAIHFACRLQAPVIRRSIGAILSARTLGKRAPTTSRLLRF
jgi:hypothetical protein